MASASMGIPRGQRIRCYGGARPASSMCERIFSRTGASRGRPTADEEMNAGRWAWLALMIGTGCATGASGPERPAASATAAATSSASASSAVGPIVDFVPGASIGPVKVGMTRAEVEALGLPVKPGPLKSDITVGPYVVGLDG